MRRMVRTQIGDSTMANEVKFRENATLAVTRTAQAITLHFREVGMRTADGKKEYYTARRLPDITLPFDRLSAAVQDEAMGYGIEVRLTRATALSRDANGKPAPVQEKWDAVKRLVDFYASGTDAWEMPSQGGGGGLSADTRVLIEALVRALGLDAEVAEEQVRGMTTQERDALRIASEIKPHIDAIYAERARSAGADASSLLGRLKALS